VFETYKSETLADTAAECAALLNADDGLDTVLQVIREALPQKLRETGYAIACEIVAADGTAKQEELRVLELLGHALEIDRLAAAAIERGARARHMKI